MEFYQTKMGHRFFEVHMPQLIKAIQGLSAALSNPTQAIALPVQPNPDFLSDLYHGNYEPDFIKQTPETSELTDAINEAHSLLVASLSDESQIQLSAYLDKLSERDSEDMRRAYESGFHTAIQMLLAGFLPQSQAQPEKECQDV